MFSEDEDDDKILKQWLTLSSFFLNFAGAEATPGGGGGGKCS